MFSVYNYPNWGLSKLGNAVCSQNYSTFLCLVTSFKVYRIIEEWARGKGNVIVRESNRD